MIVNAQVAINGSQDAIWSVIANIENASETISGIEKVEILERPENGLVGLKWRETRVMFGKSATEEMWITDAVVNEYYKTRAESHGCVYKSTVSISQLNGENVLTMAFETAAQGAVAKIISVPMGFLFKGVMKKCFLKDLNDIKAVVERPDSDRSKPAE